jgi:hypothetical protein
LIMELGTIVFLGFGLGHGRSAVADSIDTKASAHSLTKARCGRKCDPAVLDFVEQFRKFDGRTPTGAQIRTEFPDLPKSTVYDAAIKTESNSRPGLRVSAAVMGGRSPRCQSGRPIADQCRKSWPTRDIIGPPSI